MAVTTDDALIVVDLQTDFMPGGNLPVSEGDRIVRGINRILPLFRTVVATQDWHPKDHRSFAAAHPGKKPYDLYEAPGLGPVLWPDHCVQGTKGAGFHPDFEDDRATLILRKGYHRDIDSYSVLKENDMTTETGLSGYLKTKNIRKVFLSGLALDYCVFYSAKDAVAMGFEAVVIYDLSRPVASPPGHLETSLKMMEDIGVLFVMSETLLNGSP
ncbi:MAG: bifunctional nicotinamidase/pyrazinamidase [Deltaproteobacteria bacterium]|nr:bifunctional nicotinamidase/pyrazinamidase [Candidatus Zymogenaceae bacterium]